MPSDERAEWDLTTAVPFRFQTLSLLDAVWPRDTPQSECALSMLNTMEERGIIPDEAVHNTVLKVQPLRR